MGWIMVRFEKYIWSYLPLKLKFAIFYLVHTLASTYGHHSRPNLVNVFMAIKSRMSLIMVRIRPGCLELSALEFEKIAIFYLVYTLVFTDGYQSRPKLVKMFIAVRSRKSLNVVRIGPMFLELSSLEFEKIKKLIVYRLYFWRILLRLQELLMD